MSEEIICEVSGGVATVTLNRPQVLNALSRSMKQELTQTFGRLGSDPAVQAILLTGAGDRAFSAGSDIKEMSGFSAAEAEAMLTVEHACFESVLTCPKPVITSVAGHALGAGCQLAMCGDICVATEDARFGMPELKFGAVNGNETALFMYFGGLGLTRRLILGCEVLTAREAATWGIVTRVVADREDLRRESERTARELASYPGASYSRQKRLILNWLDQGYSSAVNTSIAAAAMAWSESDIKQAMGQALAKPSRSNAGA
ncbi:enoyl-CoA hydratase/isomerase family protein [bacterium]|nr:MAG: enoyl-CoA hydratase/isomerase family protein [bacterium]